MKLPPANVTVHTDYMGGGFGSKFGADIWGMTAAELSKMAGGRPVKLFLDRVQEHLAAGNRPSASAHIKLGASRDGKLVAMIAEAHGTGGVGGGGNVTLPYVYSVPNTQVSQSAVLTNFGNQRAMRAPGHPQSCTLTEAAMDDLADKLGMDPLEFRLKNLSPTDFHTPDLRGRAQNGCRADRLDRETQAARPRTAPARSSTDWAWPCISGVAAAARQKSLVHDQFRWVGRDEDRDPGPGYRDPHRAGDHRRRDPGSEADRHHLEHRQLELSARAGLGRLDHDADHGAAGL